jgi:hypothetical protein
MNQKMLVWALAIGCIAWMPPPIPGKKELSFPQASSPVSPVTTCSLQATVVPRQSRVRHRNGVFQRLLRCPFCSSVNVTFGEQLKIYDLVVTARLIALVEPPADEPTEQKYGKFGVQRIFKGENFIEAATEFQAALGEDADGKTEFLCFGIGPPLTLWNPAIPSDNRVEDYLMAIKSLPPAGAERLVFFLDYLEDANQVLAMDAYDEFAICTYDDLHHLKTRIPRQKLLQFIQNREVPVNHRRLYFTMLGVCGDPQQDVPLLERLLVSEEKEDREGLDSLTACYLCLKGADGLKLIEQQFILNEETDYLLMHEILAALRFHGTEVEIIPRERLVQTVRQLLNRPRLADMVIADLARWEDWEVLGQLIEMFQNSDNKINWIRVPIFQYLLACPLPEAKQAIEKLKKVDEEAFRRAVFLSSMIERDQDDQDDQDDELDDDWQQAALERG